MRILIACLVSAIAGAFLLATPSVAAPLSLTQTDVAPLVTQVQYGYGERREDYRERHDDRREWRDDRRHWGDGDGDDGRRRERRRMFCRYHPEACGRY